MGELGNGEMGEFENSRRDSMWSLGVGIHNFFHKQILISKCITTYTEVLEGLLSARI